MKIAVIQEFLTRPRQPRHVMAAYQTGKRLLPMDCQPFEFFQELAVQQRGGPCTVACAAGARCHTVAYATDALSVTPATMPERIVSGVCPSACASKFRMMRWRNTACATCRTSSVER